MTRKSKRPLTKGRRIVRSIFRTLGIILLLLFIVFAVMFGPVLYRYGFIYKFNTKAVPVDTRLTTEQKLKDLDYMYDIACKQNPRLELFEKAYGISYKDVYDRYRELVAGSKTEYEFFSYMASYLAILPGVHNSMHIPYYEKNSQGSFPLAEVAYGNQNVKNYQTSFHEDFRDDVESYLKYKLITFQYVDGRFVCTEPADTVINYSTEYLDGQLVSLDGKDPRTMCFELFERETPVLDAKNGCYIRPLLRFNDGTGVKHKAEILMRDGTTVTIDLYDDPAFDMASCDCKRTYPELLGLEPANNNETPDVFAEDYVPTTYSIATDKERKLVYVDLLQCEPGEGQRLVKELEAALEETGADKVIIDIRKNPGGNAHFGPDYFFPMLFSHDVEFKPYFIGKLNSYTKNFAGSFANRVFLGVYDAKIEGDYYYYGENFCVTAAAKRDYKIYLLTSQKTCSAADVMTAVCKEYDNATVIGTNTRGEGISGAPINCVLPESRFCFVYAPTVNLKTPEDSYNGLSPDIYTENTLEEYYKRMDLMRSGVAADSYAERQKWDGVLKKAIEIAEKDAASK